MKKTKFFRAQVVAIGLLATLLAVIMAPGFVGHRWAFATGKSVQVRFGLLEEFPARLSVNDYVLMAWRGQDPNNVPHLTSGRYLIKRVGCTPGQHLRVTAYLVRCDDKLLGGIRDKSLAGKPLKPFLFDGPIPEGQYFLMGDHKASYDSRYVGLIPLEDIQGKFRWWI